MICKNCGANNDDFLEYCEKCSAPLHTEASSAATTGRSFVSAPKWAKPEFNANTISESDIPSDYFSSSKVEAAPAQPVVQPVVQPAPAQESTRRSVQASINVCSKCGAPLIAGQRFCNSCGARQDSGAATAAASAWTGSYSAPASQGIKYAEPIDDTMFSYDRTDELSDNRSYGSKASKSSKGKGASAAKSSSSKGKTSGRTSSKPAPRKKRGGSPLNTKLIAMILGGVVVVGLLVFGIVKLVSGGLFSGSAVTDTATIEKTVSADGSTVYNITTFAKKGSTVRFEGGSIEREEPVTGKSVTFAIPEQLWIPGEPVDPELLAADGTLPVYPDISVINKKGESEDITFEQPIYIPIPTIDMTVTSPNTENFSVTSPTVQVDGIVGDTSASVYVGDAAVPVDETGAFTYTYNLTEPDTITLNVEARKNGYAIARKTFTIEYTTTATGGATTGAGSAGAPANAGDAKSIYYATDDGVNVRDVAGTAGNKIGTLALCEKVYVISADSNDWYKIAYNGGEAYVSGAYIRKVSDISAYSTAPATIKGDDINIRSAASSDAERVEVLANGTAVSFVKDAGNGWSMIEYNNKILFVSTQYLQK